MRPGEAVYLGEKLPWCISLMEEGKRPGGRMTRMAPRMTREQQAAFLRETRVPRISQDRASVLGGGACVGDGVCV